ncbi:MAG: rhodanese-like domain-containing protein [Propionibacteriaceae bacterium]|nr:rhodanese-like domain-containing protein [Propionibacteriaceae bacterium]
MSLLKKCALALIVLLAPLTVVGCGSSGGASIDTNGATIIDVRTASEYASGHLQGAVNIDVQSADFGAKIATMPKDGKYIVYCRSGARASTAQSQMKAVGFTNVTNAGGIDAASTATGLPIVTS